MCSKISRFDLFFLKYASELDKEDEWGRGKEREERRNLIFLPIEFK